MPGGYALRVAELSPGLSHEVTAAQAKLAIVPARVPIPYGCLYPICERRSIYIHFLPPQ